MWSDMGTGQNRIGADLECAVSASGQALGTDRFAAFPDSVSSTWGPPCFVALIPDGQSTSRLMITC